MKKALSLVLTMCIVLSLFATFVISASAAASSWTYAVDAVDSELTTAGVYTTYENWLASNPWWKYSFQIAPTSVKNVYTIVGSSTEGKCTAEMGASTLDASTDPATVKSALGFKDGIEGSLYITLAISDASWSTCYYCSAGDTVYFDAAPAVGANVTFYSEPVEITGNGDVVEWKPFFLSHFDNTTVEGAGVVFTDDATNSNHAWRVHVVFAPIAGEENAYEIVDIINYLDAEASKVTKTPVIPEGGFAYNLNYGNDYPSINMDGPDYTSPNCNNMIADVLTWQVGDKLMFKNLDLEGKTVPTSTEGTNWYDDAYVCTAQYAAYVPGYSEEEGETVVAGDNIAVGKDYVANGIYADAEGKVTYPDESGKDLTDGKYAPDSKYSNVEWVGFNKGTPYGTENGYVSIIVDLGSVQNIAKVATSVANATNGGILAPTEIKVSVSTDNSTWSDAVALTYGELVTDQKAYASADLVAEAQYVKFMYVANSNWMFIDEVEVYEAKVVSGGDEPEVIVETITVDGDLNDTGWAADGWVNVTPDNGYWQSVPETDTLSYKYQLRTDDTKLYAAFVIDCDGLNGGNGNGTNVRFWINSDSEYQLYTHFYDVFLTDGAAATGAKYNTAKDANTGAAIENSTINAVVTTADGKTYVEFSVDLAEFGGEDGFNYFICVSNKVNENVCLYYPVVPTVEVDGKEDRQLNLPYKGWYTEGQATVDVEAVKLGEVVVGGETDDDLGDAGIYAIAALAVVALIGTAVVIKKRA